MSFTAEKQIEICNAVNTAMIKGWTVKAGGGDVVGVVIHDGKLYGTALTTDGLVGSFPIKETDRIVVVKNVEIEIDVIYEPIAEVNAEYPDLSNPNP